MSLVWRRLWCWKCIGRCWKEGGEGGLPSSEGDVGIVVAVLVTVLV